MRNSRLLYSTLRGYLTSFGPLFAIKHPGRQVGLGLGLGWVRVEGLGPEPFAPAPVPTGYPSR